MKTLGSQMSQINLRFNPNVEVTKKVLQILLMYCTFPESKE